MDPGEPRKPLVLAVEDEPAISDSILYALETECIHAVAASTLAEARDILAHREVDCIVLDVSLPDGNGFAFCREVLARAKVPQILFLTARDSEIDRLLGLELGRGDYMTKPFSPRELTVRVRNLLERAATRSTAVLQTPPAIDPGSAVLVIDRSAAAAFFHGNVLSLSAAEFRLLSTLARAPGRVLTRAQLLDAVTSDPGASLDRVIDTHIKNLRAKLRAAAPTGDVPIETRRGFGYAFSLKCAVVFRPTGSAR